LCLSGGRPGEHQPECDERDDDSGATGGVHLSVEATVRWERTREHQLDTLLKCLALS
jgi:hypothetical protein